MLYVFWNLQSHFQIRLLLKWPASYKLIHASWNKKLDNLRLPWIVEQLESNIRQEWDNIPLQRLQQMVSSIPKCLQIAVKTGLKLELSQHL